MSFLRPRLVCVVAACPQGAFGPLKNSRRSMLCISATASFKKNSHRQSIEDCLKGCTCVLMRGFPKIRATLYWGPYNKDPTTKGTKFGFPIAVKTEPSA